MTHAWTVASLFAAAHSKKGIPPLKALLKQQSAVRAREKKAGGQHLNTLHLLSQMYGGTLKVTKKAKAPRGR